MRIVGELFDIFLNLGFPFTGKFMKMNHAITIPS